MELIDLVPNSMSFRVINTLDIHDESEIPAGFTGRVRRHANGSISYVAWYRDGQLHNPGALLGIMAAWGARAQGWSTLRPHDAPWPEHPAYRF